MTHLDLDPIVDPFEVGGAEDFPHENKMLRNIDSVSTETRTKTDLKDNTCETKDKRKNNEDNEPGQMKVFRKSLCKQEAQKEIHNEMQWSCIRGLGVGMKTNNRCQELSEPKEKNKEEKEEGSATKQKEQSTKYK